MRNVTASSLLAILLLCALRARGEYRSYDGSGNNAQRASWGKSETELVRLPVPKSALSFDELDKLLPNARNLSNFALGRTPLLYNLRGVSNFLPLFGQFIAHDVSPHFFA